MSHTAEDKQNLLARVRRIRGQVEGIERALEREADCGEDQSAEHKLDPIRIDLGEHHATHDSALQRG